MIVRHSVNQMTDCFIEHGALDLVLLADLQIVPEE